MKIERTDAKPQAAPDRGGLVRRANELYHDLQSAQFNEIHRRRHRVESLFWNREVLPRLRQAQAGFGVDLCTGTGFVPWILLKGLPHARVMCTDISPRALAQARKELGDLAERAEFHVGDAATVPVPDGSADWVSMNARLHHVPEPELVLKWTLAILGLTGPWESWVLARISCNSTLFERVALIRNPFLAKGYARRKLAKAHNS